jgi:hypothetical protein
MSAIGRHMPGAGAYLEDGAHPMLLGVLCGLYLVLCVGCAEQCCAVLCGWGLADEVLDGDNAYACDGCKQRCRAKRR